MIALILNSGLGSRMGEASRHLPKGMTEIGGGYTILSRQLTQLAQLGVRDVVITTGPFAEALEAHVQGLGLGLNVRFVPNPEYATTNYIVSIHRAAPYLAGEDVLLLHGDLVLESAVLAELMQSPHSVMATDAAAPLPLKDFKARLREGRIVAVGVELFGADCVACQPAYRWRAEDMRQWLAEMAAFVRRGETRVYAENAFNALEGAVPLHPLELRGRLCAEIDNPEDLAAVSARFMQTLAAERA